MLNGPRVRRRSPLWLAGWVGALLGCGLPGTGGAHNSTPVLPIQAKSLVFGAPSYRPGDDGAASRPLANFLSKALGIPVEVRSYEPYQALPDALRQGKVDIAQLTPLSYAQARHEDPTLQPIATVVISGSPTYLGHLYVRADSRFHKLADLKGARIGYVAPGSTSGYLFPRDMLRRKGFDPDTFFGSSTFLGTHPEVVQAVLRGDVDVGAAEDVTSDWLGQVERPTGLRVVAKTDRIPNDALVARPGLDAGTLAAIKRALLELLPGDPRAAEIVKTTGVVGWVAMDDARYERVRQVMERNAASPVH